jgi:hypothetical protein
VETVLTNDSNRNPSDPNDSRYFYFCYFIIILIFFFLVLSNFISSNRLRDDGVSERQNENDVSEKLKEIFTVILKE